MTWRYITTNFINSIRLEDQIKDTQGKIEKKRTEIIQVQSAAQAAAQGAGPAGQ